MNIWFAATSLLLALVPALLFLRNLPLYAPLPKREDSVNRLACSVLIPARNEEATIGDALRSVLQSVDVDFEVIVLDDGSTDRTAEVVQEFAASDARVRLASAPELPADWCGKPFACHQLALLASHPLLIFMDADVRVSTPDSLVRLAHFIERTNVALVSGVPRQETGGFMEKLIIPLIHFILLGFLPLRQMRAGPDPRFAAACGQIVAVRRDAYERSGGHTAIFNRLHDGVAMARNFRTHGFATDLFDATDTFYCRMYSSAAGVWNGFSKNANEGLGSPRLIVPATLLLVGGQVLPLILLALAASPLEWAFACAAVAAIFIPRLLGVIRFRQPLSSALFHPLGICGLVAIQWQAFFRMLCRKPARWKGRLYALPVVGILFLGVVPLEQRALAAPVEKLSNFELTDQEAKPRVYHFPKAKITVMTVADHKGSKQLAPWIARIYARYGKSIDIDGVADVSMIPKAFHKVFRSAFRKQLTYSVMLDWSGTVVKQFDYDKNVANIYVISRQGKILKKISGPVSDEGFLLLTREIDRAIQEDGSAK